MKKLLYVIVALTLLSSKGVKAQNNKAGVVTAAAAVDTTYYGD